MTLRQNGAFEQREYFNDCKALAESIHTSRRAWLYAGECFQLIEDNIEREEADGLCRPGILAAVWTSELYKLVTISLKKLGQSSYISLIQKPHQKDPSANWEWLMKEGSYQFDINLFNSSSARFNDGDNVENNEENYGKLASDGFSDVTSGFAAQERLCQYKGQDKSYVKVKRGWRLSYPIISQLSGMQSSVQCAHICAKKSICLSFSFSRSLSKCLFHPAAPNDMMSSRVKDKQYSVWQNSLL